MGRRIFAVGLAMLAVALGSSAAFAQGPVPASEVQGLKDEIRKLQERLNRLEEAPRPDVVPVQAPVPGEKEIKLDGGKEHIFETIGLPKPEIAGTKISGFFVGSANYNSHVQLVPEFAGGAQAKADPERTNFRFDKVGIALSRTFAPWLYGSAAIEIESHRDVHSHLTSATAANRQGCPVGLACERFGAETPTTEATLDKFNLTAVVPWGNGLALSLARFDVPFGIERHDEPLNLTATTSEVFDFGRPQRGTGLTAAYQVAPWLDAMAWVVNRWESETTHDPFDDNNAAKTWGGRIGFTPISRDGILNFGVGGSWGAERANVESDYRWVLDGDVTWSPMPGLLFAGEVVYGHEDNVTTRQVGIPVPMPARNNEDREWLGFYALAHYDVVDWLGLSFRYGYFDDEDGYRTGVEQVLQSFTIAPVVHLSKLIPDLKPTGVAYARTNHPINWVDLKLEYRLNHSDRDAFSDSKPALGILKGDDTSHQFQLQVVVNF
ncbi:MAG TPA: outer membrane beta-barrel protein [Methylomirabilota bacterium]|nr:outer membrane beta-barrel protein [Methylomirabilota bacterium]